MNRDLCRSHFIPKAAYKLIQQSEGAPPVVIKPAVIIQKNEQITDYVLCMECEERFDVNGERWVLDYCSRVGEGFKLKALIDRTQPLLSNRLKVYSSANIAEIDVGKLTYFVASVLWRGSAHAWKSGKDLLLTPSLGSRYEEELRLYLLGEVNFPSDAAVWVSIVPAEKFWTSVFIPYGGKLSNYWRYKFIFLGFSFMFFLGKLLPPFIRRTCTFRSPERFILVGEDTIDMMIRDFGRLIGK
ncbi:MAG: hypothetical protein LAO21_11395 [Acidobacteriia bacterium]|nr:hypothetical protein [Terriglobia bacterium]